MRRSTRSPMQYTPYTLNPSALPYGLWIDIPFRKRGSTAIRSEAKGRGARFCPAAKGTIKWWMPQNRLTVETVDWLNKNEMIRGERNAAVFNPNAMTVADINLEYPFRVYLAVPFADKDHAKGMSAKFCGDAKRWYYDATNLTQHRFDEMLKKQWVFSFHGVLKSDPTHTATGVYFFKEDFGGGVAVQSVAPPFVPQVWAFVKNGLFITMNTMADGRIILTSDDESYVDGIYRKDEARTTWNALIADGWTLVSQKENA
jgi:hypothetical protein